MYIIFHTIFEQAELLYVRILCFQLDTLMFNMTSYNVPEGDGYALLTLHFSKPLPNMIMVRFQYKDQSASGKLNSLLSTID